MNREAIHSIFNNHRNELSELGVHSLALFGSTVRDEDHAQSDVDLLVEFNRPIGLLHFSKVRLRLEELLGKPVDLVSKKAILKELEDDILSEAINVF